MSTVEAIQCQLGDTGVILFPGTPEDPPRYINDEDIVNLDLRLFPKANPHGKLFQYRRHVQTKRWYLDQDVDK